jgi:hypothetical protein
VIPGNSFHVAASDAERCALATLEFIARRGAAEEVKLKTPSL